MLAGKNEAVPSVGRAERTESYRADTVPRDQGPVSPKSRNFSGSKSCLCLLRLHSRSKFQ